VHDTETTPSQLLKVSWLDIVALAVGLGRIPYYDQHQDHVTIGRVSTKHHRPHLLARRPRHWFLLLVDGQPSRPHLLPHQWCQHFVVEVLQLTNHPWYGLLMWIRQRESAFYI